MNQILSALFFILLSSFFHHISSFLTTRAPPAHSGVSYESIPSSTSFSSSPSIATSINDITLIGTVGGYLHAVNTITLEKIWSVNIGGPLLSAQELSTNLDYSMVPMIDGSLLYRGNKGVRATSVTAKTLIENTPFHAQDGLLYNGEKFSKLYEIDLTNGQLLNDFSSPSTTSESPLKSPETSSVIVGRVDYILRAYNTETGQQEFNFSYGELTPISSGGHSLSSHESHPASSDFPKRSELSHPPNSSHFSFRKCRSSKSTSTALIYSTGVTKVTPYAINSDGLEYTLSPHSMICTPKGEAVFAYTNGDLLFSFPPLLSNSETLPPSSGHVSNPLHLDSPATFAYIFKNQSHLKTSTNSTSSSNAEADSSKVSEDEAEGETLPLFSDLDYVNDFDKDLEDEDNDSGFNYSTLLSQQISADEEQYSAPTSPPLAPDTPLPPEHPLPFPQSSSSSSSHPIPILYQLEIPSPASTATPTPSSPSAATTTLQISSGDKDSDPSSQLDLTNLLSKVTPKSSVGDSNSDFTNDEISLNAHSHSLMIYSSISSQASNPTLKASYHESLVFPLSSSITVTLQKPISQSSPHPSGSSSSAREDPFEGDGDGYLLISESDVSSWVVGMRVPYPFTHPRYDPTKISTIPLRTTGPHSFFSASVSASAAASTHRLPSFKPSSSSASASSFKQFKEMKEMLSSFDYYRYSTAYGEYEKCLHSPDTETDSGSGSGSTNCNLTEFLEMEKMKHFNQFKFYEQLNSGTNGNSHSAAAAAASLESNTIGLLVLAGIFGGIFVSILLILSVIFYLNSLNKNPLTMSEIVRKLISTPQQLITDSDSSLASVSHHSELQQQSQLQLHHHRPQHHNLEIFHEEELGRGSNGTVVLRGLFEGRRHVAVKKMVARFHNFERERSILSAADGHSNVVRYIQSIQEGDFYLLVLELCNMSLWHYLYHHCSRISSNSSSSSSSSAEKEHSLFDQEQTKATLFQIASGVAHLHSKNIIHRDIKPQNILLLNEQHLTQQGQSQQGQKEHSLLPIGSYQIKISDMGLSKLIDEECEDTHDSLLSTSYNSSLHPSTQQHPPGRHAPHGGWGGGTIGWSPPEIYQKRKNRQQSNRISDSLEEVEEIEQTDQHNSYKAADIFSLGCVFHFVLVPGMHPFGNSHERLQNILNNQSNLSSLRQVSPPLGSPVGSNVLAYDLIQRMIRFTPSARPNITQILSHPYFWSFTTRLDFLNDFSDRLQFEIKSLESLLNLKHVDVLLYNLDSTSAVVVKEIRRQWSKGTGAGAGAGMGHRHGTKGKSGQGGGSLKENLYLRMETMRDVKYDNQSILFHPPTSSVSSSSSPSLSSGGPAASSAAASASDTTALTEDHTNTGNDASHDLPSVNPNGGEKNKMKKNHLPWDTSLPEVLVTDLLTHGKYNFSSITDCLRMIRNKRRHRDEIPRSISSLFETDELFYSYFESLYPNLFISCLVIAVKYLPKDDPFVIKYCSKLSGIFDADEVIHLEENEIFPEESTLSHSISSSFSSEHSSAPADSSVDSVSVSSSSGNSTGGSGRSRGSRSSSGAPAVSGSASGAAAGGVTNFRTRMCHSGASCPFRAKGKCTFAHSEEELIVRKKRIVK